MIINAQLLQKFTLKTNFIMINIRRATGIKMILRINFCNYRNLCSWICMISALSQTNNAKEALALFRSLDIEPDEITIVTMLYSTLYLLNSFLCLIVEIDLLKQYNDPPNCTS